MRSSRVTIKQVEIVTTLRNYAHLYGYSPSIRDLCRELGKSRGTIFRQILSLEKKGVLRRHPRKARAIEILRGP
jgi:repressor LexA